MLGAEDEIKNEKKNKSQNLLRRHRISNSMSTVRLHYI